MDKARTTLVDKAKNGDADAFAELFEPLREMVYAIACRVIGPNDADDVVMETYLKAWQAFPRFSGRASLKTWLYRITHNCAIDFIRKRSRRKERVLSVEEEEGRERQFADEKQPTPDEVLSLRELVRDVRTGLERLPDAHRVVLELRYTDDLSYSEIAAATGVSIGTVMSRLFNGKRKLRKILEGEGGPRIDT